jgi:HSP20 family protein
MTLPLEKPSSTEKEVTHPYLPPCDSWTTPAAYFFHLDLPGVEREALCIELNGQHLRVFGHRGGCSRCASGDDYHECPHGDFERIIVLPAQAVGANTIARYGEGILELEVPKTPSPNGKVIEVIWSAPQGRASSPDSDTDDSMDEDCCLDE